MSPKLSIGRPLMNGSISKPYPGVDPYLQDMSPAAIGSPRQRSFIKPSHPAKSRSFENASPVASLQVNSSRRCSNAVAYQVVGHRVPAIREMFQFELATYSLRDAWRRNHNHSHVWEMIDSQPSKYPRLWAFPPLQRIGQEDGLLKSQDTRQFASAKTRVRRHRVIA
jgi:hypothetical protein